MADKPILLSHLFRPSGPLGSLSVKIDLAHLLGLISESAHKDLLIIKDIRNAFAHKLFVDSFENQSVKDRCKNLMIPDLCYGEEGAELDGPFRVQFTGATAALRDPRARYVLATTAIADQLGVGSTQTDLPKPYV